MLDTLRGALRQWSILIVGLVLLFGGMALGMRWDPPGGTNVEPVAEKPTPQAQQQAANGAGQSKQAAPRKTSTEAGPVKVPPPQAKAQEASSQDTAAQVPSARDTKRAHRRFCRSPPARRTAAAGGFPG